MILVAATTENPSFSVIAPLLSRSLLLTLEPLSDDDLGILVDRAVTDPRGLARRRRRSPTMRAPAIEASRVGRRPTCADRAGGGRRSSAAPARRDRAMPATTSWLVTAEIVATAVDRALLRYDRQGDEHYDVISAFIKSVGRLDADASLHYLRAMIEAGRTLASSRGES